MTQDITRTYARSPRKLVLSATTDERLGIVLLVILHRRHTVCRNLDDPERLPAVPCVELTDTAREKIDRLLDTSGFYCEHYKTFYRVGDARV